MQQLKNQLNPIIWRLSNAWHSVCHQTEMLVMLFSCLFRSFLQFIFIQTWKVDNNQLSIDNLPFGWWWCSPLHAPIQLCFFFHAIQWRCFISTPITARERERGRETLDREMPLPFQTIFIKLCYLCMNEWLSLNMDKMNWFYWYFTLVSRPGLKISPPQQSKRCFIIFTSTNKRIFLFGLFFIEWIRIQFDFDQRDLNWNHIHIWSFNFGSCFWGFSTFGGVMNMAECEYEYSESFRSMLNCEYGWRG